MRFVPSFADYIRTKPISPYQKHKDLADGSLEVRLELIPNKELFSLLLSYGAQVTILEPASLARQIKQEYKRAAE